MENAARYDPENRFVRPTFTLQQAQRLLTIIQRQRGKRRRAVNRHLSAGHVDKGKVDAYRAGEAAELEDIVAAAIERVKERT